MKVLFLCTGNSCRSQMAEGWARSARGDSLEPYSAGIETHGLNEKAVLVMAEAGVEISGYRSRHVDELAEIDFDFVITLCDHARQSCPLFSGSATLVHKSFPDPPALAAGIADRGGDEQAQIDCYRRVRDQIKTYVQTLPESLGMIKEITKNKNTWPVQAGNRVYND